MKWKLKRFFIWKLTYERSFILMKWKLKRFFNWNLIYELYLNGIGFYSAAFWCYHIVMPLHYRKVHMCMWCDLNDENHTFSILLDFNILPTIVKHGINVHYEKVGYTIVLCIIIISHSPAILCTDLISYIQSCLYIICQCGLKALLYDMLTQQRQHYTSQLPIFFELKLITMFGSHLHNINTRYVTIFCISL